MPNVQIEGLRAFAQSLSNAGLAMPPPLGEHRLKFFNVVRLST